VQLKKLQSKQSIFQLIKKHKNDFLGESLQVLDLLEKIEEEKVNKV
jgi:hypothetical protein